MSFFDGEACPDDNLKGILSIHLKLGKYIHSIKIWKSLDFGIDWSRNGRVINRAASEPENAPRFLVLEESIRTRLIA